MLLLPCGRQEKNTIKHFKFDKDPHGWKQTRWEHGENEIQCKSRLAPPHYSVLPVEAIGILSEENLFIWCCIFLFCPLEEIPELALRRLMPQLPSPCSSSCWQGEETPHTLFRSVNSAVYTCVFVCKAAHVCVGALCELWLYMDPWCEGGQEMHAGVCIKSCCYSFPVHAKTEFTLMSLPVFVFVCMRS